MCYYDSEIADLSALLMAHHFSMSFQYIQPTEEQKELMQEFRDKFEVLAAELHSKVPSCRGLSLALTKLEESAFWLNKGITKND